MDINDLLRTAIERQASDLHLKTGTYPILRIDGTLVVASEDRRLEGSDAERIAQHVMSPAQWERFAELTEIDLAYSVPGLGRFRCNVYRQRGTVGLVFRVIPTVVPTIDDLELPSTLKTIAEE